MKDIIDIPFADEELLDDSNPIDPPDNPDDRKVILSKQLREKGHKVICSGRSLVTIERADYDEQSTKPFNISGNIVLTFYGDPDVTGVDSPSTRVYLSGSKYGLQEITLEYGNGEIEKIY